MITAIAPRRAGGRRPPPPALDTRLHGNGVPREAAHPGSTLRRREFLQAGPAVTGMMTQNRLRIGVAALAGMLLAACGGSSSPEGGSGAPRPEPTVLSFSAPVGSGGDLVYVPFEVPEGVQRIEARYLEGTPGNIGIGVFDAKGTDFLGTGFRGIAGTERRELFIAGDEATLGFIPGPIMPGQWHIVMPNYYALGTAQIEVTLHYGEAAPTPQRQAVPEQVIV